MREFLTFDDVLMLPKYSEIDLEKVSVSVELTKDIKMNNPFISAAMDTVTESNMAIAMSLNGGLGVIHKNMSIEDQVNEVKIVKNHNEFINKPVFSLPDNTTIRKARIELLELKVSSIVVLNEKEEVIGLVTLRDLKFVKDDDLTLEEICKDKAVITANINNTSTELQDTMYQHKVAKLPLVDDNNKLQAITSLADISRAYKYNKKAVDKNGKLVVAAAVSTTNDVYERIDALVEAGVDAVVIDSAHGNSKNVINVVKNIRDKHQDTLIIAGNIVTPDAVRNLAEAGADIIKVGIGSGSICTTRIISGVGVPQLSAVMDCVEEAKKVGVKIIADGGIKYSGDIAKALAAGADFVMLGSLLAGHEQSPGEKIVSDNKIYKSYIGMGSMKAMKRGGGDRYFQSKTKKYVPEGVESLIEYKGDVEDTIYQLVGGLRSSLGYNGAQDLKALQDNVEFIKITAAGKAESHPHSLDIISQAPNYK